MKQLKLNNLQQVSNYFLYKYICRTNNLDVILNVETFMNSINLRKKYCDL